MLRRLQIGTLAPPITKDTPASVLPLLAAIAQGAPLEPIIRETAAHFGGCDNFEYGVILHPQRRHQSNDLLSWLFTTFPDDSWERHWDAKGYVEVDPRMIRAQDPLWQSFPGVWSCAEVAAAAGGDTRKRDFARDAAAAGLGSGVSFSLPDARVSMAIASWSMADPDPSPARVERLRNKLGEMMVWTTYWHAFVIKSVVGKHLAEAGVDGPGASGLSLKSPDGASGSSRSGPNDPGGDDDSAHGLRTGGGKPALTARQCEVLTLVAEGLYASEIAGKIGTTARTVNEHLAQIRDRLGARNTHEAIAIAARKGLFKG